MGEPFFCKTFRDFYDAVSHDEPSLEVLLDAVERSLPPLAADKAIGQVDVVLSFPPSVYAPQGIHIQRCCYKSSFELDEQPYGKTFSCGEGGMATITVRAKKGAVWSDADKADFDVLMGMLAGLCTSCRLRQLLDGIECVDMLTGALNTRGFVYEASRLLAADTCTSYAAVYSDIKNFRSVNRMTEPADGDAVLKKYCAVLRTLVEPDTLLCRPCADTFLVLIRKERLDQYLEDLCDIAVAADVGGRTSLLHFAARCGVFVLPGSPAEPRPASFAAQDIVRNVSVALTEAKKSHVEDVVMFRQEFLDERLHTRGIASSFPDALARMEFLVYYQPIVRLETNVLCGCEALSRWQRDRMVFPSEFIPALEDEGSIRNLDFYMLEAVCHDIRQWKEAGIEPVRVSTNFSKASLSDDSLEETILSIMQKYGVEGKYIEIELSDLADFRHVERLAGFVAAMKAHGISTSIDNFGAGSTPLNLLRSLRAGTLKLDKSLTDAVNPDVQNSPDKAICHAIVSLSRQLGMETVAAGVESRYQADFLRKLGCSKAQGFLYDRPLPHDEFEQRLVGLRVYD